MPNKRVIQLLLADDHEMVRSGVKALLAGTEIKVVAEATTGRAALKLALEKKEIDVVLLDICMPDGDGLAVLSRVKLDRPDLPVLLFSAFENPASIAKAIALGAGGFLLKGCTREELLSTIRTAANGASAWSYEKLRSVTGTLGTPGIAGCLEVSLSARENDVLRQIALCQTNKQIAATLQIDCRTVHVHIQHIFRKIGLRDRTQAALWAVRKELV